FLDDQGARRDIPGAEAGTTEYLEAATGDITEIESGGAGSAASLGEAPEGASHLDRPPVPAEADRPAADERRFGLSDRRHRDGLTIKGGAVAEGGGEELIGGGIVDYSRLQLAIALHPNGYGEGGDIVGKVRGPIHWIDQPTVGRDLRPRGPFLGQDPVSGESSPDALGDQCFRRPVSIGHQVVVSRLEAHLARSAQLR